VLLKHARFYLGSDTGLAHLAEAVGTRSRVIFGPTRPELGFGPWRPESLAISLPLACAPCSKDGKTCFRLTSPYLCMRGLSPDAVAERCP
jgi:ADP-heptose:LPS heptosyltransferase